MSIFSFWQAAQRRVREFAGDAELTIGPRPLTAIVEQLEQTVTELKERQADDIAQVEQLDKDIAVIQKRQANKRQDAERAGRIAQKFEELLK
ncbi:hypothetical protein phiAS5_ORF0123 [Aeromonas phage phiAS5]|uniref:Uncharacterized protein n=1 Tax=Aeromonas phage phiAS5 TaxID=879630 RepID=E1A2M0_9CAUD|nr:hypothetical protein phiAS5_ORF0123 [Aeromonas phage phiAS5]ADM79966.1 hypothetical protein phiAS5_ORF0123 [Aeromonas phage phiAS5]BES53262.1 hypothetical protein [Aeromonas phage phiWae14]